ncbi:uncharacterized protein LOC131683502 [Topomyia yanbarensis]|uniref:uncharacterized protein LOC131683502 n=1 Tax=Topomyia yanbarensis TaxID=2498891 RepID=UPI00273C45DD|nr:uncharacterized protein LOC131683502 [Topomyia yanbarensis]XP_058821515.1 uncharacterized protein LOC131683502 [Topomyia yanbarensis]
MEACTIPGCRNKYETFIRHLYTIPPPSNLDDPSLVEERSNRWKKLCRVTKTDKSYRVCSDHFFFKQPAETSDKTHPDWLPWLKLCSIPDDPLRIQRRMQEYYQQKKRVQQTLCIVKGCINSKPGIGKHLQSFAFPKLDMTSYINRVLSEKRLLLWLQIIDQPDSWRMFNFNNLKICPRHFVTGKMAELTDVENVDWIPSVALGKKIPFTDHVAHFDLHNIISLAKDTCPKKDENTNIHNFSLPTANTVPITMSTPAVQSQLRLQPECPTPLLNRIKVGLKCILCLEPTALKAIDTRNDAAIKVLFSNKLNVESELICSKCCKLVEEFYCFYEFVLRTQQNLTAKKIKTIIPVIPEKQVPPVARPKLPTSKVNGGKLFDTLPDDYYQCTLCKLIVFKKKRLNHHLHQDHKVKISCKMCKQSFSPDGYTEHKNNCQNITRAKRDTRKSLIQAPLTNADIIDMDDTDNNQKCEVVTTIKRDIREVVFQASPTDTKIIDTDCKDDKQKGQKRHSCYICKNFYTPEEMMEHVKSHGAEHITKRQMIEFGEEYEACKECQKAILKDDMEKHLEEHEEKRARRREFIKKQQEKIKHTCFKCNVDFLSLYALDKHTKSHKIVRSDDKIVCPDCNRIVKANYFKVHCQFVHDDVLLTCDKCGKQMTRMALKRHRQTTCCDDTMAPCEVCGKTMKAYLIKSHTAKVHSSKPIKCSFCPKVYDSKDYARSHERWSHREEWDKRRREGIKELNLDRNQLEEALGLKMKSDGSEEVESSCPICLNVHGNATVVETHMRKAHPKEHFAMIMGGVPITSCRENELRELLQNEEMSE